MISNITVSDIFGNSSNVSNDTPLIAINSHNIQNLVKRVSKRENDSIYEYNFEAIVSTLNQYNIDIDKFGVFGSLYFNQKLGNQILLVSNTISKPAQDFTLIASYNTGSVWLPVGPSGFSALGLVYSTDNTKPSIETTKYRLIPNNYCTTSTVDNKSEDYMSGNEFNLLSHVKVKHNTIIRSIFYNKHSYSLINNDIDAYLTASSESKLSLAPKNKNTTQKINYSVQGELIIDDKCLSVNNNDKSVFLEKCNDTLEQKWFPYDGVVVSQYDNTCLDTDGQDIVKSKCNNSQTQKWSIENQSDTDTDYSWNYNLSSDQKGRSVVLVKSDNPWYINKDITEIKKVEQKDSLNDGLVYRTHADVLPEFQLDLEKPDLGYGHSYASRQGKVCSNSIEHFTVSDYSTYFENPLLWLAILFILILVIKLRK
jgi:hypothetical protein